MKRGLSPVEVALLFVTWSVGTVLLASYLGFVAAVAIRVARWFL